MYVYIYIYIYILYPYFHNKVNTDITDKRRRGCIAVEAFGFIRFRV